MTWEAFSLHSSYSTTLTFHICAHTFTKVFSAYFAVLLIPFKRDYLSASNNFKLGFFQKVVRNQKPRAYICVTLSSNSLYTMAFLVPGSRLSILYPFSTLTCGQPFCQLKLLSLSKYFHISGIVFICSAAKNLPRHYLGPVCNTDWVWVFIYLLICSVVHY